MTGHRSDTAPRAEGFDERMERGFAWVMENGRTIFPIVGGLVLLAAIAAGIWEFNRYAETQGQDALASVDDAWVIAMGGDLDAVLIPEPANADQARKAREAALLGFQEVIEEHAGTRAAEIAALRAAQMEADLAQLEAAEVRLGALADALEENDVLRGMALRIQGFVREQQGRFAEAGEAYAAAANVETYPAHATLWIASGDAFARAGANEQAIASYEEALGKDPDLAEEAGVVGRIDALRR